MFSQAFLYSQEKKLQVQKKQHGLSSRLMDVDILTGKKFG
jgi:hypothetical protein